MVVNIIIKVVIGWDVKNNKPTEEPGLCGIPEAFTLAIKEQGHDSLHMHVQAWAKEYNEARKRLFHSQ
jgi:hypothetical protein